MLVPLSKMSGNTEKRKLAEVEQKAFNEIKEILSEETLLDVKRSSSIYFTFDKNLVPGIKGGVK